MEKFAVIVYKSKERSQLSQISWTGASVIVRIFSFVGCKPSGVIEWPR